MSAALDRARASGLNPAMVEFVASSMAEDLSGQSWTADLTETRREVWRMAVVWFAHSANALQLAAVGLRRGDEVVRL